MSVIPIQNIISAVEARKRLGELLDKAFYRNESFIVERAGEPKAVIVPMQGWAEMKRLKREAKNELLALNEQLSAAFSDLNEAEAEQLVNEAVKAARANDPSQHP